VARVFASSTDGIIDSIGKYAWGENIGWINFGTTEGNVHVTDSALTGYAWAENIGWISLNCSNDSSCGTVDYKVLNDGEGNLSGYAWSENAGWISFKPAHGGVVIDSSGNFSGYAWGENIGWIVFNCATTGSCGTVDYKVSTDWRPKSARPTVAGVSTGGGGLPPEAYNPPKAPAEGFRILINNGAGYVGGPDVVLSLSGGPDAERMVISNFADFHDAGQEVYQTAKAWNLCQGLSSCPEGKYTVYAKFFTKYGQSSAVVSDEIELRTSSPIQIQPPASPPDGRQPAAAPGEEKKGFFDKIKDIFSPGEKEQELSKVPVENLVPKQTPLALQGRWQLLPSEPIRELVFAPLPSEIGQLAKEMPQLNNTFNEVGVGRMNDLGKLADIKLSLPNLTESAGLSGNDLSGKRPENLATLPDADLRTAVASGEKSVPLAALSPELKAKLPKDVLFMKTGAELIDYKVLLSLNEKGQPQQEMRTIAGKPLILTIKPEPGVKDVRGFLVFKSRQAAMEYQNKLAAVTGGETGKESGNFKALTLDPARSSTGEPQFGIAPREVAYNYSGDGGLAMAGNGKVLGVATGTEASVEERLVLQEFAYSDPDGDGIYTATIQAPVVDGEYEIITVMDYEVNGRIVSKEVRMKTVVDPEGYVFEKNGDKETRVPGAVVSIYRLNAATKQYELWPAKDFQQENPQVTDITGKYSFLVPPGKYYISVEAPGYEKYESKPFEVSEGPGVHFNIELKSKNWWIKVIDWKTGLLILVVVLLIYNFYRDKKREKAAFKN